MPRPRAIRFDSDTGDLVLLTAQPGRNPSPKIPPLVKGLKNPESVVMAPDGRMFVSVIGEFDKPGDGAVMLVTPGKAEPFATGLDDPKGLASVGQDVFVADGQSTGGSIQPAKRPNSSRPKAFGRPAVILNDLAADEAGNLYVSDIGRHERRTTGPCIAFPPMAQVTCVADTTQPAANAMSQRRCWPTDGQLWIADFMSGEIGCLSLADGNWSTVAEGLPGADGLVRDLDGNLYISQWSKGRISVLPAGSNKAGIAGRGLSIGGRHGPRFHARPLAGARHEGRHCWPRRPCTRGVPTDVDRSPLAVRIEPAFPSSLEFDRPLVLTHADDGSNRVYRGLAIGPRVLVSPTIQSVSRAAAVFRPARQGALQGQGKRRGLAGPGLPSAVQGKRRVLCLSTRRPKPRTLSVISRFTATGPDHAHASRRQRRRTAADSAAVSGTTTAARWPSAPTAICTSAWATAAWPTIRTRQRPGSQTLLGKILRIDVDRQDAGKKYAVPAKTIRSSASAAARPEIYAYGVRNIWRLAFDRQTRHALGRPTWARTSGKRSTSSFRRQLRLEPARGHAPLSPQRLAHRDPT